MEPIIIEATNEDGSAVIIANDEHPEAGKEPETVDVVQALEQDNFSSLENRNVTT